MRILFFISLIVTVLGFNPVYCSNDSIQIDNTHEMQDSSLIKEFKTIAHQYFVNNQFEKSLEYQFKHLDLVQKEGDSVAIAQSLHRIASSYRAWDKYKLSIQYHYKAYAVYKELGDSLWMANEMNDIGYTYLYYEDYSKVIEFYRKSLDIYRRMKIKEEIALAEANIGFAYSFWGKQDEAIKHHTTALEIYHELKDTANLATVYYGLGDAERRRGNNQQALKLLKKSLKYREIYGDLFVQIGNRLRIAQVYTAMEKYNLAEQTFLKCLPGLRQRNSGKWWKNYFEAQYELYQKQGNYPKALDAFKQYKTIEDSLFNQRLQSEIIEMQILNETKEKEQKILLLQTKNELAQTEIRFQRKILAISIITIFVFATLLGFIYRQYLSRNRAYKKLFEKNKALIDYENKYKQQASPIRNIELSEPNIPSTQLKQDERERIIQKLEQLIEGKKLYLNSDLNLNQLSKKLQTNSAYLSQVINQQYGKNINSYINEYRIKEVQRCLINGEHKTLTIEAIASKAGFKTRATFNAAFKKITGLTPSFYINSLEQENLSGQP